MTKFLAPLVAVMTMLACSLQSVPAHVRDYASSPRLEHFDDGAAVRMHSVNLTARVDEIGPKRTK